MSVLLQLEQESFDLYFMIDALSRHEKRGHFASTLELLTTLSSQEPFDLLKLRESTNWFLGEIDCKSVDEIFTYIKQKSASVEVLMAHGCFRLAFRIPEVCLELKLHPKFMMDSSEKLQDIPRDNPEQKVLALVKKMKLIQREMRHISKILSHKWLWPLASVKLVIEFVPFWIAIVVTFLILMFYENDTDQWGVTSVGPFVGKLVLGLNILQTLCVVLMMWSFVVVDAPMKHIPESVWENENRKTRATIPAPELFDQDKLGLQLYEIRASPLPKNTKPFSLSRTTLRYVLDPGHCGFFYYLLTLLIASVVGLVVAEFWAGYLVMEFFRRESARQVTKAVITGAPKLLNSFIMGFIIILFWISIGWYLFQEEIDKVNPHYCDTVYQCALKAIQDGFRGDLNTMHGDNYGNLRGEAYVPPERFYEDLPYQFQLLFVLIFVLVWENILSGIIQGQIIDAFAEIRAMDDEKLRDCKERCLVCSMSRYQLEETDVNYFTHITQDHEPWAYVYCLQYLLLKDPDEYTGIESHIIDKYSKGDPGFLPVGHCVDIDSALALAATLSNQEEASQQDANSAGDGLESRLTSLETAMQELVSNEAQSQSSLAEIIQLLQGRAQDAV